MGALAAQWGRNLFSALQALLFRAADSFPSDGRVIFPGNFRARRGARTADDDPAARNGPHANAEIPQVSKSADRRDTPPRRFIVSRTMLLGSATMRHFARKLLPCPADHVRFPFLVRRTLPHGFDQSS